MENGHEDVANSRRTLWSRSELQGENGNETREGNADQLERSSSASESNVADTESIGSDVRGREQHQGEEWTRGDWRSEWLKCYPHRAPEITRQGGQRNDQGEGRQILSSEQHDGEKYGVRLDALVEYQDKKKEVKGGGS